MLAAGLALATLAAPSGTAWATAVDPAAAGGPTLVTVEGTLQQDVLDTFDEHGDDAHAHGDLVLDTAVRVGDDVLDIPESVLPGTGSPASPSAGDTVVVTLRGREGDSAEETVRAALDAEVATDADHPGPAEPTGDAPAAQVVAVAVAPEQHADVTASPSVLGQHTLALLPVTWTSATPQTRSALTTLATSAAAYWSEQSGGRVTVVPTVPDWKTIADPGSCDVAAIMDRALAAHGVARPSDRAHVAVYFPHRADCPFAGRATITGGSIWINGSPQVDVLAHELGHNLGLGHANTTTCRSGAVRVALSADCDPSEYTDAADVMGYATSQRTGNLNSAFADHLGLATVREVTSLPATVDLARLSDVGGVRALRLPTSLGTLYVDFRPAQGRDVRVPAWAGVQVHRLVEGPYPQTELLDMNPTTSRPFASPALAAGASWDVPGTGQRLTVTATGATTATLNITSTAPTGAKDLTFVPITPTRVLDTRIAGTPLGAGESRPVVVAGTHGIPAGALAVSLNLTAVDATSTTYLGMWPTGQPRPDSSVLNTDPTRITATGLMLGVGSGRSVSVFNAAGQISVVVDVTGYYLPSGGDRYGALAAPVRVLDTRVGGGAALSDGGESTVTVAGQHGIPGDATAVLVNVTTVGPQSGGFVLAYPAGTPKPTASTVNHLPGGDAANRATVRLNGRALTIALQGGSAHVVVDVVGWFGPTGTGLFTPVTPVRTFDTRRSVGPLHAGESRPFPVRAAIGAPVGARTAVMVLTATGATAPNMFVTAWSGTGPVPGTSDLNVLDGKDRANLAVVPWAGDGSIRLYGNVGDVHLIGDVLGYFS